VLYVEDNPANMRLMEQILKLRTDIHLLKAHEPLLGLELAAHYRPDLIMLDINLPGMSGYDMLQLLKNSSEAKATPVVAISATAMPTDIQRGLDAGFTHYITKPIKLQQLFDVLDELLVKRSKEVKG
jgi:CheY-like chemotaxis protein